MGTWTECKNCGKHPTGNVIYLCKHDNFVFCEECGEGGPNLFGNKNCSCPVCGSASEVRILGEIDPDAYEPDTKCENCGNVDPDDMLYCCNRDDLFFCEQCGDKAWNIAGNNNCVCPECHSTSDVKIIGEIGGRQDDADDNHDVHTESRNTDDGHIPESSYSYNESYDDYTSYDSDYDAGSSGSSKTSYGFGSSNRSGSGSVIVGLFIIAIVIIVIVWLVSGKNNTDTTTTANQAPVITYPQQAQPEQTEPAPTAKPVKADSLRISEDSIAEAVQLDTDQMKSNIVGHIGNIQYTDQIFNVNEIKSITILNRINSAGNITVIVYLELTKNRSGQIQMNYTVNNNVVSLTQIILLRMDFDVAIPADQWVSFRPITNFNMKILDDSRMYWKAFTDGQEYETGADVGPVTLPSSNSYLIKSRGDGPLVVKIECTPYN